MVSSFLLLFSKLFYKPTTLLFSSFFLQLEETIEDFRTFCWLLSCNFNFICCKLKFSYFVKLSITQLFFLGHELLLLICFCYSKLLVQETLYSTLLLMFILFYFRFFIPVFKITFDLLMLFLTNPSSAAIDCLLLMQNLEEVAIFQKI